MVSSVGANVLFLDIASTTVAYCPRQSSLLQCRAIFGIIGDSHRPLGTCAENGDGYQLSILMRKPYKQIVMWLPSSEAMRGSDFSE
jgi:hypothetical protein